MMKSLPVRRLPVWLFAALICVPGLFLAVSWNQIDTQLWTHLVQTQLSKLVWHSIILAAGVGVLVLLIGVWSAWWVVRYEFPGRKLLQWLLVLPLAFPPYVLAFVYSGWLSYAGPLRTAARSIGMDDPTWLDSHHPWMVCLILSLALFPYVYLVARAAFLRQTESCLEAARSLGAKPGEVFWRVHLPMARPAVIAGVSLALMEALGDFGAVSILGFDTFTTAIYKSWFSFFSLPTAAQLASLLLLAMLVLIIMEKRSRGRAAYHSAGRPLGSMTPQSRTRAWLMTGTLTVVVLLALLIPLGQLLYWTFKSPTPLFQLNVLSWNTAKLALLGAIVVCVCAALLAWGAHQTKAGARVWPVELATIGYALPGTVLAVAVLLSATWISRQLGFSVTALTTAGIGALLIAYTIRFLRLAFSPIQASITQLRPSMMESAQSLGVGPVKRFFRIVLPMLRPGFIAALLMVMIEIMKELPMTLMLRPFGQDTLATKIYELSSEGEWERAALPALILVLVGALPALWLLKDSRGFKRKSRQKNDRSQAALVSAASGSR